MRGMIGTRYHYWISTVDPENNNKPYLIYACPARDGEETARQKGMEMLGGVDFQIKRYPTKDIRAASAMLRGKRLERSQSLREAGRRLGHDKSLRRLRRRELNRREM